MLFSSELQLLLLKKLKLSVMLVYNKAQDTEAFFCFSCVISFKLFKHVFKYLALLEDNEALIWTVDSCFTHDCS